MTTNAKLYVTAILLLGMCVLMMAFAEWHLTDPVRFVCFSSLAIAASVFKVLAPGMAGSMPFNFLFVLVGLLELSLPETLLIGCSAVVIECVWRRQGTSSLLEAYFSVANMAVAIAVANRALVLLQRPGVPDWVLICVITLTFFLCNTFPPAAVVSLSERAPLLQVWRASHWPSAWFYVVGAALAWGFQQTAGVTGWPTALTMVPGLYLLYRTYRLYVGRIEDEKAHAEQLADLHLRTIESLALAIEAKDDTTSDHLRRVQVYAVELGRELGMKDDELEALRAAAILHDIGKLAVPEYIISKPGRLTPEEFEKMKVHPVVGAEILEHVRFPYPVVPIVRAHHEKWNGGGYPYGIKGEEIPLGARILSAVDVLDALASDRQYRRALPLDVAMAKIEEESGRSFDPRVVAALKRHYTVLEKKAQSAKGSGLKLSVGLRFGQGAEPAAGFENTSPIPCLEPAASPTSLLENIALARRDVQSLFESGVPTSEMALDEICAVFALRLQQAVAFDAIAIFLVKEDRLVPAYVHGDNYRLFISLSIPMGQGLSGWVAENRKPIINGNPSVESGYLNNPSVFSTLRSALSLPLEGAKGVIGVISLYRDARDAFDREHLRVMESTVARLALAMERALHRGRRDSDVSDGGLLLDGVTLLRHLDSELTRSKRLNSPLAVLVYSVEGTGGLTAGEADQCRRALLSSLERSSREYDATGRTAENEFVLIMPGVGKQGVEVRAAQIAQSSLPHGGAVPVAGYALFPDDGTDAEQLLAVADRRLYLDASHRRVPGTPLARVARSGWLQ